MDRYDLVILGSGSTAFAAALRAEELGKTAVLTEERTVGGTCVNRGCLPSKNLIEAAKLLHDAQSPRYPGRLTVPVVQEALRRTRARRAHHLPACFWTLPGKEST